MPTETVPNRLRPCQWCGKPYRPYFRRERAQRFCSNSCRCTAHHAVQRALDFDPWPLPQVVDQRVPEDERDALKGHNALVLDRLRAGGATGADLERLLGPGSAWRTRVSDVRRWLRRRGETVAVKRLRPRVYLYRLETL